MRAPPGPTRGRAPQCSAVQHGAAAAAPWGRPRGGWEGGGGRAPRPRCVHGSAARAAPAGPRRAQRPAGRAPAAGLGQVGRGPRPRHKARPGAEGSLTCGGGTEHSDDGHPPGRGLSEVRLAGVQAGQRAAHVVVGGHDPH